MKVILHVAWTNMFLFDLKQNHKPIPKTIVYEAQGNFLIKTRWLGESALNSTVYLALGQTNCNLDGNALGFQGPKSNSFTPFHDIINPLSGSTLHLTSKIVWS